MNKYYFVVVAFGMLSSACLNAADEKPKNHTTTKNGRAPDQLPVIRCDHYGDPLPAGAIARLGTTRFRHGGRIDSVAVAPNGKTIATAGTSSGSIVRLWDARSGKLMWRLGHGPVRNLTVTFSSDSRIVAAAGTPAQHQVFGRSDAWTIWLWDAGTGKELAVLRDPTEPQRTYGVSAGPHISFSHNGKLVGLAATHLTFWEVTTKQTVRTAETDSAGFQGPVVFSPAGPVMARVAIRDQGPDTEIHLYDSSTLKELRTLREPGLGQFFRFSPDGRLIASPGSDSLLLVDVTTGRLFRRFGLKGSGMTVAFSPDGKRVAAVSCGQVDSYQIQVWDVGDGHEVCWMKPNNGRVYRIYNIEFLSDKLLVSTGQDGMIHFWDATSGANLDATRGPAGHQSMVNAIAYLDDGAHIASAGPDGQILWWESTSGRLLRRLINPSRPGPTRADRRVNDCGINTMALSTDRKILATGSFDSRIRMLDAASGTEIGQIDVEPLTLGGLAFAPGKQLASAGWNGNLAFWDVASGQALQRFAGSENQLTVGPCISPDGSWLAVAARPISGPAMMKNIIVWDSRTGRERRRFGVDRGQVSNISLSPDGRILAVVYASGAIVLWDPETGRIRREWIPSPPSRGIAYRSGIAFSPDSQLLCTGDEQGKVSLWDILSGTETICDPGSGAEICCASFAPDGKTFATAGSDMTIMIWDATGRLVNMPAAAHLPNSNVAELWADLGSSELIQWRHAYWTLVSEPESAIQMCQERVRPARQPDCSKLTDLLAALDSNSFADRSRATESLRKMLTSAEMALVVEKSLRQLITRSPSLEAQTRAEKLLSEFRDPLPDPEMLRNLRAVSLLARIATPDAQRLLHTLAEGSPDARLTQEAKASLERLTKR
jgi:WD40 repeat protein